MHIHIITGVAITFLHWNSVLEITFGHRTCFRTISGNVRIYFFCPGKMSAQRKRGLQSSSVINLDNTDMHKYTMILFKKVQSSGPCDYTPIARALAQSWMSDATTTKIKRKFETAYVIAKE